MERVLITGAGRGIGLEYARQYAARGDRVLAGCRYPDRSGPFPDGVEPVELDVTDSASINAAVERIGADEDGGLDVLINNAGLSPRGEELSNLDAEAMLDVFRVNAVAPVILLQRFRRLLAVSDRPRVVNMSSSMGSLAKKTYGRHYSYASSKAALNMLTRAAAHDLAAEGVIVIAMHPGWVQTDLGGAQATLSPRESVTGMIRVIDGLKPEQSSRFLTWQGDEHPW